MKKYHYQILSFALPIILWEVFSLSIKSFFFPSFETIFNDVRSKIEIVDFFKNIWSTLYKSLITFVIANFLGIAIGYLISLRKEAILISSFTNDFFRSLPTIVLFPLFMIVFGINDFSKILVTTFGLFWIVLFNTINSLQTLEQVRIRYLKSMNASSIHIFQHCVIFILTKNWIANARICLNLSLLITITLEMFIGSESGIGKVITDAKNYFEISQMYF